MQNFELKFPVADPKAFAEWYKKKYDEDLRDEHARITCDFYKKLFSQPRKTPAELKRIAAKARSVRSEASQLMSQLPRESHSLIIELKKYADHVTDLSKRVNDWIRTHSKRLGLKRPQQHWTGFFLASCAIELKNITVRYTANEDLPWIEEQLRKSRFPGWHEKTDEIGGDGRTVRQLIAREVKRLRTTKQSPPIAYIPPPLVTDNLSRMSPEETVRHAIAHFSWLADRQEEQSRRARPEKIFREDSP